MITYLSYFKYNDMFCRLNVYKILLRDQQVVDSLARDGISVWGCGNFVLETCRIYSCNIT